MHDINTDTVVHPLAKYRNHLEFNGYHVEEDDNLLVCRHPRKSNLIVTNFPTRGALITTAYSFKANIKRMDLLEYVNELNSEFLFMKGCIDREGSLTIETFFEGDYDRTNFSILLDNIEHDIGILDENELTEEYLE